jgi:hypothetical protein
MPSHQLQGRRARAEPSSRDEQFFDTPIEPIFNTSEGPLTRREYFKKKQLADPSIQFSMYLGPITDSIYSRRRCTCGGEILFKDNVAFCQNPKCATAFNIGGNTKNMLQITRIYGDGRQEAAPPPEKRSWQPHDFLKAAKAAQPG